MGSLPRSLLRHARAARGHLIAAVVLGLAGTGLILAQAGLLARLLAGAATGTGAGALRGPLITLALVLLARAAVTYGGEAAALRAAATVKSQLRRALIGRALALGPAWLASPRPGAAPAAAGHREGELATLATRGLDGLDAYFARYLPQLVLAVLVPLAVLARVAAADWLSALIIAVTLPLVPVFAVLTGLHTRARTQRQWTLLARLGGHFLDVVEGLPTLRVFGRARAQEAQIGRLTSQYAAATMGTLRIAFLSALVLELSAALATALVAVEVGLRLLGGHLGYQTALLVLLLTPEAFLPLRSAGAQFHASIEGVTAAAGAIEVLETPLPPAAGPSGPGAVPCPDLSRAPGPGAGRADPGDPARRSPDRDRPQRGGQVLAAGPAPAVRRPHGRNHPGRRARLPRGGPGRRPGRGLARPARLGTAARAPVRRHRGRQHRARPARREPGRHPGGRRPGGRRRVHHGPG